MSDICKNCGGQKAIHHWKTMQCPFGGVEAGVNRPDVWIDTTFDAGTDDEVSVLRQEVERLRQIVDNWMDRIDELEYRMDAHIYSPHDPHAY